MAKETERAEAAAQLERRMAAMEAVLAARRTPVAEAKPEAARGPGADLRFQVSFPRSACRCVLPTLRCFCLTGLSGMGDPNDQLLLWELGTSAAPCEARSQ